MSNARDRLRTRIEEILRDPLRLAVSLAAVVLVVGFGGVLKPLQGRIDDSRGMLTEASGIAETVRDIALLVRQEEAYRDRLHVGYDLVEWQDYVLHAIDDADCELGSMESGDVKRMQDFRIIELPLVVRGQYSDLRDFIDRMERGSRLVRFDHLVLEPGPTTGLTLRCTLRGMASALDRSGVDEEEGDA